MGDKLRVVKSGFTVLPNEVVRDDTLTLEAFGLLAKMLSLPDDWDYSIGGLASICGCGRDKIRSALNCIEKAGYMLREQGHGEGGKFVNTYVIFDVPDKHRVGLSDTVQPCREIRQNKYKDNTSKTIYPPKAPQGGRCAKEPKKKADWKPKRFEGLWQFYPHDKRGNRQKAIAAWDKLKPDDALIAEMGRSLELLLATLWSEVGTPHVSTFLNGCRWEDAANVEWRSQSGTSGNTDGVTGWL